MNDAPVLEGHSTYTKCCAINVTAESLATMARILCNDGVGEESTKRYMSASSARLIKTLMLTCGMYDGSGTFVVNVGIPSKSGVGGGIMSVSDKRAGIGVFDPSLDPKGNSIAGIGLLKEISNKLTLNLFYDPEWDKEQKEANFALNDAPVLEESHSTKLLVIYLSFNAELQSLNRH